MFASEKDFQLALDRLNAINHQWLQWQATTARKEHEDEFGDLISDREVYFTMPRPGSVSSTFKLSRRSMETYLGLMFQGAPMLEKLADQRRAARSASDVEAFKALE
ncbi:hypothetical protein [Hydrogenophaga sp.]|uniref:hypothetical protein n=1 Tax=Hydrogenophaga sp. TaxID=1904254 RepID=UPI00391C6FFF